MTRRFLTILFVALALLPATRPASAAPKTIKLGTIVPSGSVWDNELKSLGSQVQQKTGGRVAFKIYAGGTAGDDPDIVRKLRLGTLQAATLTVDGLTDLDKGFGVFSVPRFFSSFDEMFAVAHALTPTLSERLDKQGYVFLNWGYGGWVYFFSKQPIYTPADLKKTKMFVWAGDDRMVQWWKNNGYQPKPLASVDIMAQLQTGGIDVLPSPALVALVLQWYRQAPNMLDVPLGQLIGGTVISKKAWEQLTPEDQAALRQLAAQMQTKLEQGIEAQDRQAVEQMSQRGLVVTKPKDAAQVKAWDDAAAQFASSMREQNLVPADIFDQAKKIRDGLRAGKH
jgi:TRAP-type transport system periplasmic protein